MLFLLSLLHGREMVIHPMMSLLCFAHSSIKMEMGYTGPFWVMRQRSKARQWI